MAKEITYVVTRIIKAGRNPAIGIPKKYLQRGLIKEDTPYVVILREIESD